VDIHAINRIEKMKTTEERLGAFNGKKALHSVQAPMKMMSPAEHENVKKLKEQ